MNKEEIARISANYASGSAWDRFHVKQRLQFFPHEVLLPFLPERGTVLDIGCGFGLLGWYLAQHRPGLEYYGADIDERKVALAKTSFSRQPGVLQASRLHTGDVRAWQARPAKFNVVCILDVLLLMPLHMQRELFDFACDSLVEAPDSVLLLKIQPMMNGAAHLRTWIQETIMVRILRKTKSSGALYLRQDPTMFASWGKERGLSCEEREVPTYPPSTVLAFRRTSS